MALALGDRNVGTTIRFVWPVSALNGTGIVRSTDGTVTVYKDGNTTQVATGVTDTDNFDSQAGLNLCVIDTSADGTFYSAGSDFDVVLLGATVDGQTPVTTTLAHFTLGMMQAVVDAIKAKTDNLPSDPADQSAVEAYVDTRTDAIEAKVDIIDAIVDAITAKTTNLPSDPADQSAVEAYVDTRTDAIEAKVDIIDTIVDSLTARLPAALDVNGNIKADIEAINAVPVTGDGQSGTEFNV